MLSLDEKIYKENNRGDVLLKSLYEANLDNNDGYNWDPFIVGYFLTDMI